MARPLAALRNDAAVLVQLLLQQGRELARAREDEQFGASGHAARRKRPIEHAGAAEAVRLGAFGLHEAVEPVDDDDDGRCGRGEAQQAVQVGHDRRIVARQWRRRRLEGEGQLARNVVEERAETR